MDVVAAILIQNKKILLAKRPPHKNHGGLWEFPGGKVQEGESHQQALVRELHEELGLVASVENLTPLGTVANEKIKLHLLSLPLPGPYSPLEHTGICWNNWNDLGNKQLCPTDKKAIQLYSDELKQLCL